MPPLGNVARPIVMGEEFLVKLWSWGAGLRASDCGINLVRRTLPSRQVDDLK